MWIQHSFISPTQRFCLLNKVWVEVFDNLFQEQV